MIVWFFGASATGKKTMMLNAANTNFFPNTGRDLLGIDKNDLVVPIIVPNRKSGRREKCHLENRIRILSMLYTSPPIPGHLLIHGQTIDIIDEGAIPYLVSEITGEKLDTCVFMNPAPDRYERNLESRGLRMSAHGQLEKWRQHKQTLHRYFKTLIVVE